MIRAFFTDMDGTLWDEYQGDFLVRISDMAALRRLSENGIKIVVTTGRGKTVADRLEAATGINGIDTIGANGAVIYIDNDIACSYSLDIKHVREIISQAVKFNLPVQVQTDQLETFFYGNDNDSRVSGYWARIPLSRRDRIPDETGFMKVTIATVTEEERDRYLNLPLQFEGLRSFVNQLGFVEVIPAHVNKGYALTEYCRLKGIDPADTAFIGDEVNDIEAMEAAGISFCMSKSPENVRYRADRVVNTVSEAIGMLLNAEERIPNAK